MLFKNHLINYTFNIIVKISNFNSNLMCRFVPKFKLNTRYRLGTVNLSTVQKDIIVEYYNKIIKIYLF